MCLRAQNQNTPHRHATAPPVDAKISDPTPRTNPPTTATNTSAVAFPSWVSASALVLFRTTVSISYANLCVSECALKYL